MSVSRDRREVCYGAIWWHTICARRNTKKDQTKKKHTNTKHSAQTQQRQPQRRCLPTLQNSIFSKLAPPSRYQEGTVHTFTLQQQATEHSSHPTKYLKLSRNIPLFQPYPLLLGYISFHLFKTCPRVFYFSQM